MTNDFNIIDDDDYAPGWIERVEGICLKKEAEKAELGCVLEIGSLCGRSASFILDGLRNNFGRNGNYCLWCVDPWDTFFPAIIERVGLPPIVFWQWMQSHNHIGHFKVLQCRSDEAAPLITQRKYDFAFIDGNHRIPWPVHDLVICSQVTNTIYLHDYDDDPRYDVKEVVNQWVSHTNWNIVEINTRMVKIEGPPMKKSILSKIDETHNKHQV